MSDSNGKLDLKDLTPEQKEEVYLEVLKKKVEQEIDFDKLAEEEFELNLKEVKFTKGPLAGYILREMDGKLRDAYNAELYGVHMKREGENFVVVKHEGFYANLLTKSIWTPNNRLVTVEEVQKWPGDLQDRLYRAAHQISGLGRKGQKEAAKNS